MTDEIQRAMEAVMRASAVTTDWQTQRKLLAMFDELAGIRRASLREGVVVSTNEQSLRGGRA